MRLFYKSLVAATALLGVASSGYSLPSAEKYADISILADPDKGGLDPTMQPIFPQDDEDPNIVYAPYDQVYIKHPKGSVDERVKFGLTYDEAGVFLSMTVRAGYSPNRVKAIQTIRSEGKKVLPCAIPRLFTVNFTNIRKILQFPFFCPISPA